LFVFLFAYRVLGGGLFRRPSTFGACTTTARGRRRFKAQGKRRSTCSSKASNQLGKTLRTPGVGRGLCACGKGSPRASGKSCCWPWWANNSSRVRRCVFLRLLQCGPSDRVVLRGSGRSTLMGEEVELLWKGQQRIWRRN